MLKEKDRVNNPFEELGLIVDTIRKTMEVKAKTIKIKKVNKDEKRDGLLGSGATNNVREVKTRESHKSTKLRQTLQAKRKENFKSKTQM